MIYKILTVAALATFEIYAAIPAGFAFKLNPFVIFSASLVGGLVGVFVAGYLGDKIKNWFNKLRKNKTDKPKKEPGFILKIWEKYGVIGLGLIGTLTVGAPISIGVGVGFNVPTNKMVFWCCLGVLIRCTLFTIIGHFGMKIGDLY
jgi:membrane protein YqaA with SNARE-associated domain